MIREWPESKTFHGPTCHEDAVDFIHQARREAPTGEGDYVLYDHYADGSRSGPWLISDPSPEPPAPATKPEAKKRNWLPRFFWEKR